MVQRVFVGMLILLFGISTLSRVGNVMGDDTTLSPSESPTLTPSLTMTPTLTPTQTLTPSPTWTPVIINIPVTVAVTQIVPIVITQIVQATTVPYIPPPPIVIPALPTALIILPTKAATPRDPYASQLYGWRRHESIEFVQVLGQWVLRNTQNASDGAYHNTEDSGAIMRFPFTGDGIRVGFRIQRGGGSFQIKIDNQIVGLYETNLGDNASQAEAYSAISEAYFLSDGYHIVDFVTNGAPIGFDYLEVFVSPRMVDNDNDIAAGANTLIDMPEFKLVYAPPTLLPSPQPITDQVVSVDIVVAYDSNNNKTVDPAEGIRNVSIRAVDSTTNTLLASAITDDSGFVRLQVITTRDILVVIPLLGESYVVRVRRSTGVSTSWTILLPPANVPGLIP